MSLLNSLWVEKYRPQKVEDIILPDRIKKPALAIVESGNIPNMLLSGPAGTGKTTLAKAVCKELDADVIVINGSEDRNIDTVRHKVRQFASTVSFSGGVKVVIYDEADGLAPQTQQALRALIEEFSSNCRFILTCNFKGKIIEPLHSRCTNIDFTLKKAELPKLCGQFFDKVLAILDAEGVEYDKKPIIELIQKSAPDWRKVLGELQIYSTSGKIDTGILVDFDEDNFKSLITYLKGKKFKDTRKWVVDNMSVDPQRVYRKFYDTAIDYLEPASVPQLVLLIAEYQYKQGMVMDGEINLMAFFVECMSSLRFK